MNLDLIASLIIATPLVGFLLNGLLGLFFPAYRNLKTVIGSLATIAVVIPFLLVLSVFLQTAPDAPAQIVRLFTWIQAGSFTSEFAYRFDQLSLIMGLIVTGVGALIHLYSMGYMKDDEGCYKFFAYLNLFIFMMMNLVMGNNLLLLFLGWEGVGVSSYLLIGFWYQDNEKAFAGKKAFIYNRVGDFAFLVAMFMTFKSVGSLDFDAILNGLDKIPTDYKFWIAFLMFFGATGKSAQLPLFVWLPDAMAGPTPVSALIHAATMVTSGIYLIARMSFLYVMVPEVMIIVAAVGAVTAIVAASIAITQQDIKKVLAYSTVSQLGYMFLSLGSGGFIAAIFHVVTHAFFKACLFLGSGSVIHAMHHVEHELHHHGKHVHFDPQDMRFMGGLKKYMPSTYITFLVATIAIAGIPPLAGFFSKDEILAYVFNSSVTMPSASVLYIILWVVGIVTALMTAFYMFRLTFTTFHGEFKLPKKVKGAEEAEKYLHESPITMTLPLWVLGILSVVGGFMGIPDFILHGGNWLHQWLEGVTAPSSIVLSHATEWMLLSVSVVIAIVGVSFAYLMYFKADPDTSDALVSKKFGSLYTVWSEKYRLDEFYEGYISDPIVRFSEKVLAVFDMKIVDGFVNLIAGIVRLSGSLFRYVQTGLTSSYAFMLVVGVVLVVGIIVFS